MWETAPNKLWSPKVSVSTPVLAVYVEFVGVKLILSFLPTLTVNEFVVTLSIVNQEPPAGSEARG